MTIGLVIMQKALVMYVGSSRKRPPKAKGILEAVPCFPIGSWNTNISFFIWGSMLCKYWNLKTMQDEAIYF